MPKAASRPRNPNPVAMLCRSRLTIVLWTRKPASARIAATNRICKTIPRTAGSCHGGGRFGFSAPKLAGAVSLAMAGRPGRAASADRHRVDQAALGPQIVEPALQLERAAHAEIMVEHLTVIADRLDLVIGPFLVEPERLAHAGGDAEDTLDGGVVAFQHVVDILLGDPLLLGLHQGK